MTTLALFLLLWCGASLVIAGVWSLWAMAVKRRSNP